MTYSYTQISQYLSCPRRYKHRYLDGWKEKDTRAAMMFGRAFEQAVGAYFQRQDAAAVLYREWSAHRESGLHYSERDSWDRMLQSGVQLLDRFAQDDRVRIRQPRAQLAGQIQQALGGAERLRGLRRCHRRARRHPLPARVEDHCQPLSGGTCRIAGPGSSTGLLFLGHRVSQTSLRWCLSASDWSRFSTSEQPSATNSAKSSATWFRTQSEESKRPSSCLTVVSAFPRTPAPAVLI